MLPMGLDPERPSLPLSLAPSPSPLPLASSPITRSTVVTFTAAFKQLQGYKRDEKLLRPRNEEVQGANARLEHDLYLAGKRVEAIKQAAARLTAVCGGDTVG
jgi:hypothetical protein